MYFLSTTSKYSYRLITYLTLICIIFLSPKIVKPDNTPQIPSFKNVTHQSIYGALCQAKNPFDVDFMDANSDGYFDLFAFSHGGVKHCLYLQKDDGSNMFVYADGKESNYVQEGFPPRGSLRATFHDLNGDKKEDITSVEKQIASAVWINGSKANSFIPKYKNKKTWCSNSDICNVGDIDGDGLLDVVHTDGYIETYEKRKKVSKTKPISSSYGWFILDMNNDSWPDLFDASAGGFWKNIKGDFEWINIKSFEPCKTGFQQDFADFNNDGYLDVICSSGSSKTSNSGGSRFIFKNLRGNNFINVTPGSNIEKIGWKSYWANYSNSYTADFNNDGLIDIVFAGSSYKKGKGLEFLINKGDFKFDYPNIYINDQCNAPDMSYGCKPRVDVADYDNDGLLDLLKMYSGFEKNSIELYKNTTKNENNWLKIRVRGKNHNTEGLHTQLYFYDSGTQQLIAYYQISNHFDGLMRFVHAGLNKSKEVNIEVVWPHNDGKEIFKAIRTNQELIIKYSADGSKVIKNWKPGNGW